MRSRELTVIGPNWLIPGVRCTWSLITAIDNNEKLSDNSHGFPSSSTVSNKCDIYRCTVLS